MLRYISDNNNFEIRVNGLLQNQVYFRLTSVDFATMYQDEYGIKSFKIILINHTVIEVIRTNQIESVELITKMFNNLIDQMNIDQLN